MAVRTVELTVEADPILDSIAESYGGNADLALSELLIAHEAVESFLDEFESENTSKPNRQREATEEDFAQKAHGPLAERAARVP